MSLRTKLLVLVELLAMGGVVIASAIIYRIACRELEDAARCNLDQAAYLVATQAELSFSRLVQETEMWAEMPLTHDTALNYRDSQQADKFNRYFDRVRRVTRVYQSINLVNLDADCVASSNAEAGRLYHPDHRRMVTQRSDFIGAKAGQTSVSGSIMSQGTGRPGVAISVPIRHGGTVGAVLRVVVDLGFFHTQNLAHLRIGDRGRVVVFDPTLDLTLDKDWRPPDPLDAEPYKSPDIPGPPSELASESGFLKYETGDGPYLAAFRRTQPPAWVFVVSQPLADVLQPVRQIRNMVLAATLALTVLIGGGIFLVTDPVIRALAACQAFARQIQAGRLAERLSVRSNDEIGQLGRSLNDMATSLQENQEAVQAAERKYRGIFENAIEGIFVTTEQGCIIAMNPACARILGYDSPDAVVGTQAEAHYADPTQRAELVARLRRDRLVTGFEFELVRRDGSRRLGELHAVAEVDASGNIVLVQGFIQDITARRGAERDRDRARDAERLLAEARLQALRYQVNPHFLFNVLNTIDAMSRQTPDQVPAIIRELSRYLRTSLDTNEEKTVPLRGEIELVESYLKIEKFRFEDDLEVVIDIPPDTAGLPVPCLLLQPLVENAVKYGMKTGPAPLRLSIRSTKKADRLQIEVANTGQWVDEGKRDDGRTGGIGLKNLRKRLDLLFQDRYQFEHQERDGCVVVRVELPVCREG